MSENHPNHSNGRRDSGESAWPAVAKTLFAVGALAVGYAATRRPRAKVELQGKVTLITGSRGLGLAIAKELGHQGARIALCARDANELEEAVALLAGEQIEAAAFPADVSDREQIGPLVSRVLAHFGRIDILVNNAGDIKLGPFDSFTLSDYQEAMDLMFWAALNLTFAVLPEMRKRGEGHVVNITSVGGRVSVPHLLPYSCAKFAAVGFSTGLSAELHGDGIRVLTVVPGLMRTGSYLNAKFKGKAALEFAWFSLIGNLPGLTVAAEYAAHSIRTAIEDGRLTCTISLPAKILIACDALLPEETRSVLSVVSRVLPSGDSKEVHRGKALNAGFGRIFQVLTAKGHAAAERLNE